MIFTIGQHAYVAPFFVKQNIANHYNFMTAYE